MPARSEDDHRAAPPIGRLIEEARVESKLSQRKAASFIGITGRAWGYIVLGEREGRAETLARMAHVVGLSPDEVARIRVDVAALMRSRRFSPESPPREYDRETVLNLLNAIRANCDPAVLQDALAELGLAPPGWSRGNRSARP